MKPKWKPDVASDCRLKKYGWMCVRQPDYADCSILHMTKKVSAAHCRKLNAKEAKK